MKRALFLGALVATIAASNAARAQSAVDVAKAEGLFNEGVKLLEQKKYAEACVMLDESRKIAIGLGVTLYLADCYDNLGKTGSALQLFRAAEKMAAERKDAREHVAHDRAEKLEKTAPRVVIRVPSEVAAARQQVIFDGRKLEAREYGAPMIVDPGTHKVRSLAEDGNAWESDVSAASGGTAAIDVPPLRPSRASAAPPAPPAPVAPAAAPEAPPPPHDADRGKTQRMLGLTVGGAGIVALGVGAAFGLSAKSKQSDSNADGHCDANDKCDPVGLSLRQDALSAATASTILFVAGGAAVVGGALLFVTAPKAGQGAGQGTGLVVAPAFGGREGGFVARGTF